MINAKQQYKLAYAEIKALYWMRQSMPSNDEINEIAEMDDIDPVYLVAAIKSVLDLEAALDKETRQQIDDEIMPELEVG